MKIILLFSVLLSLIPHGQTTTITSDGVPVTVVGFRWFKERHEVETASGGGPAAAMIPQNKNFERNRRANTSPGERDPNLDTIDGRSAALERAVQDSRAPKPIEGFAYRAKVHNGSGKPIQIIFWEYQLKEPGATMPALRRQFLCVAQMKPEKNLELQAFSLSGPHDVVSVNALKTKTEGEELAVINRVEFADGSIWQRKDWSFGEIRMTFDHAISTPWGAEMCRGL
jgi:antitoxin (DNA-binding transcriptional repressor) of toxin-antitoxin stability system